MLPNPERRKGAGPLLGVTGDGERGPFGVRSDDDQESGDLDPVAAVDDRVQALVAAARARRERRDRQRQALEAARAHGLAARHRAKLARLDDGEQPPPDVA